MAKKQKRTENRHHLIFWRSHYSKGYAKLCRDRFIYPLDIRIHDELHHKVLNDIPRPSDKDMAELWHRYEQNAAYVDALGIVDVCRWLAHNVHDSGFRKAMFIQADFLERRLRKGRS